MQDPFEQLSSLRPRIEAATKSREECDAAMKHHEIETRVYRGGLDHLTAEAKCEIGRRLANQERQLLRTAAKSLEESIAVTSEFCDALRAVMDSLCQITAEHSVSNSTFKERLAALKDRDQFLNQFLGD